MARLTNSQVYKYFQGKVDKANAPYIPPAQMALMYTESRLEWLRLKSKDFEVTTLQRSDLRPFIKEQDFGSVLTVSIPNDSEILYTMGVWANFEFECKGVTRISTRPIRPLTIDEAAEIMMDPFNQPNDEFPAYVERSDNNVPYLDILCSSAPVEGTVFFIKSPKPFELLTDPNGYTDESETAQFEIIDIAVKKAELEIENLNKFQGMREEISNNG